MRTARLLLCLPLFLLASPTPVPERLHLVVLHTNDVHGQLLPRVATWVRAEPQPLVGGIERLADYVAQVRAQEGEHVLLVDGGDWFQGTPEGLLDGGDAFLRLLVSVGYDAMCVGNHEFDHGVEALEQQLVALAPPAVLAGVSHEDGARLAQVPAYRLFERAGLSIAVVGLLTPVTPDITHESARWLRFEQPGQALAAVRAQLAALEHPVDLVLPVTHIGVDADRVLAQRHPDLPLIVGGHSHTFLKEGEREGRTWIVQTGSKLSAVGRVDLWFDADSREVVESRVAVISLYDEVPQARRDPELHAACDALVERSAKLMDEVLGRLEAPLTRAKSPYESSNAGNFITDAMRRYAEADVAIQNRGGIRCDLPAGELDRRGLFELLPFGNNLVVFSLTGAQLEAVVKRGVEGMAHSGLEFSGMQVSVALQEAVDGAERKEIARLAGIRVGGQPLAREAVYRVATNSFLAGGGDGYIELAATKARAVDPILLRDLLATVFEGGAAVAASTEARYHVIRE